MKVAIVHYWFITRRGGEKVVESILKLYPEADIYTLFYDKSEYGNYLKNHKVYTSSFNCNILRSNYQKIFPLYPNAVKSLKLKDNYDLIISSESGPVKGIKIINSAKHICYIHTPMRYCWGFTDDYLKVINPLFRPLAYFFFKKLKTWDLGTIDNVDLYIANSKNVAARVKKYYNKESIVIYPPIETKLFNEPINPKLDGSYFLSFGAITPYKRIDLLVDCFNKNNEKLIVIGDGSEKEKLEYKAKKNIQFKGRLDYSKLKDTIKKAKCLIFPGEEDFGMIPLEVMALGIPVIAFKKGGALETVIQNLENISESSGLFFNEQNIESIQNAINQFLKVEVQFNRNWIRNYAKNFEESKFLNRFSFEINQFLEY